MSIERAELRDVERKLRDLNHRLDQMEWRNKMRQERQMISLIVAVVVIASGVLMGLALASAQ